MFHGVAGRRRRQALRAYGPELLLLSAGFDGGAGDEGNNRAGAVGLDLQPADFAWLTQELLAVSRKQQPLPLSGRRVLGSTLC